MFPFGGAVTVRPPAVWENVSGMYPGGVLACVTAGWGISATFVIVAPSGVATKKLCP